MTTLQQSISKVGNDAVGNHRGQKAKLHHGDSLQFLKGNGWGTGDKFTEVDFYPTQVDCTNQTNRVGYWKPDSSSGLTDRFTVTSDAASVTLTDAEPTGPGEDLFYAVKIGGLRMDPEVINKGGQASDGDPTAWIP